MYRKLATLRKPLALAALATAGITAALLLTAPRANAYSARDLPDLGYSVMTIDLAGGCRQWKAGPTPATRVNLGSDCDPGFQARLDAFIQQTCTCISHDTTTAETTTSTETVTVPVTTTVQQTILLPQPQPITTTLTTTVMETTPAPEPPVADFTTEANGRAVTLTALSVPEAATVTWQPGDGSNEAGATVTHHYLLPGVYTVVETVTATDGLSAQAVRQVDVLLGRTPLD